MGPRSSASRLEAGRSRAAHPGGELEKPTETELPDQSEQPRYRGYGGPDSKPVPLEGPLDSEPQIQAPLEGPTDTEPQIPAPAEGAPAP
jgi:hypothetical protein